MTTQTDIYSGEIIDTQGGHIMSPNYPDKYNNRYDEVTNIIVDCKP